MLQIRDLKGHSYDHVSVELSTMQNVIYNENIFAV
jgi:hypothetical protein